MQPFNNAEVSGFVYLLDMDTVYTRLALFYAMTSLLADFILNAVFEKINRYWRFKKAANDELCLPVTVKPNHKLCHKSYNHNAFQKADKHSWVSEIFNAEVDGWKNELHQYVIITIPSIPAFNPPTQKVICPIITLVTSNNGLEQMNKQKKCVIQKIKQLREQKRNGKVSQRAVQEGEMEVENI